MANVIDDNNEEDIDRMQIAVENDTNLSDNIVWDYFEVENFEEGVAKCKLCLKTLSYRTTIANLRKHLAAKHSLDIVPSRPKKLLTQEDISQLLGDNEEYTLIVSEDVTSELKANLEHVDEADMPVKLKAEQHNAELDSDGESEGKGEANDTANEEDMMRDVQVLEDELDEEDVTVKTDGGTNKRLRSQVWQYFDVIDKEARLTVCKVCNAEISYRTTTTNLVKHLYRAHKIRFEKCMPPRDYKPGKFRQPSTAWRYFSAVDPARKIAVCLLCDARCSYRTSVSNLMKHVKRRHGQQELNDDTEAEDEKEDEGLLKRRACIWKYFRCIDEINKISICLLCKRRIRHISTLTNLKRHIWRKHPHINLEESESKIIVSSGGQLYEVDSKCLLDEENEIDAQEQNDINTEEDPIEIQKKLKKRKLSVTDYGDSSGEDVPVVTCDKQNSIDHFGTYVASLLKQLPKSVSNELQINIIKQIMSAQSECGSTKPRDNQNVKNVLANKEGVMEI